MSMSGSHQPVRSTVILNNSRETFTPTASGAIATCIWELTQEARRAGEEVVVVTIRDEIATYGWPEIQFIQPASAPGRLGSHIARIRRRLSGWARPDQQVYAKRALAILQNLRPRAVICNNDPEVAVYLSRTLPSTTIVHWFHNLEIPSDRWRRAYVADRRIHSVAVSAYLARAVEQVYRMTPLSVAVALNGVDSERFFAERGHADCTIGFVGRLAVEKAPDTLLRACLILAERGLRFRVQIVGDTNWGSGSRNPYVTELDHLMGQLAVAGVVVHRTGHLVRDQVAQALRSTDVHVVPSRWDEPCGLTILEGLASGAAVVASATGGTPELLSRYGLLFPRDDHVRLAEILEMLVVDAKQRKTWGDLARERALQLSWASTWAELSRTAR